MVVKVKKSNRFLGTIRGSVAGVKKSYQQHKKAAAKKAIQRMKAAVSKADKERIKAEKERVMLTIQREMYEAKLAVKNERKALLRTKRAAGKESVGERANRIVRSTVRTGARVVHGVSGGGTVVKHRRRSY